MASEGGSKSADPSVEVPWREESSESDWKAEQADGRKTDAAVKEQLRVLTENFTLRFMDVKDSALLSQPPLAGVPVARIKNLIKYQRAARVRGGKLAEAEIGQEEEKRPAAKKRPRKEVGQPIIEPPPAKRQQIGSTPKQAERDLALARQLVGSFASLDQLL